MSPPKHLVFLSPGGSGVLEETATSVSEEKRALTILWRIENVSCCRHGVQPFVIGTCQFQPLLLAPRPCYLRMWPNADGNARLQLSVTLLDVALGYKMDCEWSFLDADGSPLASATERNMVARSNRSLVLSGLPTGVEVFETRKSSFLPNDALTVRLRFWKTIGEFVLAERLSLLTRLHVGEHAVLWPIEGFGALQLGQSVTKRVHVRCFPPASDPFELRFSLTGATLRESAVRVEIDGNRDSALMRVGVSVLDDRQEAVASGSKTLGWSDSGSVVCVPGIVSRRELLARKSRCLVGDVLNLLCVLTYSLGNYRSMIEKTYLGASNLERDPPRGVLVSDAGCQSDHPPCATPETSDSLVALGDDFLSLYRNSTLCDFELRSADASFPVHKLVLAARSPFFRDLFSKSESGFLEVPDVDDHTLDRALIHLYSGALGDLQWEDAAKLYRVAHRYGMESLKRECCGLLRSGIGVSNVCDVLALADRHRDRELSAFVHDFILENYDDVLVSEEWRVFLESESYLAGVTVRAVSKRRLKVSK